ncbi:hypothetical protein AAVH_02801 [Aphelenchoides avenae]|nr:hypothetical protein AAVH_02801 [Aphelenchus avenae]
MASVVAVNGSDESELRNCRVCSYYSEFIIDDVGALRQQDKEDIDVSKRKAAFVRFGKRGPPVLTNKRRWRRVMSDTLKPSIVY